MKLAQTSLSLGKSAIKALKVMNQERPIFTTRRKRFPILASLVVAIIILLFAANWLIDENKYKPLVEEQVKEKLSLPVTVGSIDYSVFSPSSVTLRNMVIGDKEQGLYFKMETAEADLDILPLLSKNVSVDDINLNKVEILATEQGINALIESLNSKQPQEPETPAEDASLPVGTVFVEDFDLTDLSLDLSFAGKSVKVEQLSFSIDDMLLIEHGQFDLKQVLLAFQLSVAKLQVQNQQLKNIQIKSELANGVVKLSDFSAQAFGGSLSAQAESNIISMDQFTLGSLELANLDVKVDQALLDEFGIKLGEAKQEEPATVNDTKQKLPEVLINELKITNSSFDYQLEPEVKVTNVNLALKQVKLSEVMERIVTDPLTANLSIDNINFKGFSLGKLVTAIDWKGDTATISEFTLSPTQSNWLALTLSASSRLGDEMGLTSFAVENLHLDTGLVAELFPQSSIKPEGAIDLAGNFTAPLLATSTEQQLSALDGSLKLDASALKLKGVDIDSLLSGLKDSQEVGLTDLGAVALTGPIGLVAGNLFDLGKGATTGEGETDIGQLSFSADVKKGVLDLTNSALATGNNRVAFDGGIDLAKRSFQDFNFALLDANGCASLKQTLNGSLDNPTSAVANTLIGSLVNPLKGLLGNLTKKVTGNSKCDVFYQGNVTHPTP